MTSVDDFVEVAGVLLADILRHREDTHPEDIGAEGHADLVAGLEFESGLRDLSVDLDPALFAGFLCHGASLYYS